MKTVLLSRLEPSFDRDLLDAAHLMSRCLPLILVLLNDVPFTAIIDAGAELLVVSSDEVFRASLFYVDCECHQLIVGKGTKEHLTSVVWAHIQYQDVLEEHNFTVEDSAHHQVLTLYFE